MDFNLGAAQGAIATESMPTRRGDGFDAVEWMVINLARHDGLASLWSITRLAARLFGLGHAQPLANPRLESLRRLAVVAWHRRAGTAVGEIRRFLASGFSSGQARLLIATIEGRRQLAELRGEPA